MDNAWLCRRAAREIAVLLFHGVIATFQTSAGVVVGHPVPVKEIAIPWQGGEIEFVPQCAPVVEAHYIGCGAASRSSLGLLVAGVFHRGAAGSFGITDQATFAAVTFAGLCYVAPTVGLFGPGRAGLRSRT
jgi:hypothetical protein